MAPKTSTLHLWDQVHNGNLVPALIEWHAQGMSLMERHHALRDNFGLDISPSTIRRWSIELGENQPQDAA